MLGKRSARACILCLSPLESGSTIIDPIGVSNDIIHGISTEDGTYNNSEAEVHSLSSHARVHLSTHTQGNSE